MGSTHTTFMIPIVINVLDTLVLKHQRTLLQCLNICLLLWAKSYYKPHPSTRINGEFISCSTNLYSAKQMESIVSVAILKCKGGSITFVKAGYVFVFGLTDNKHSEAWLGRPLPCVSSQLSLAGRVMEERRQSRKVIENEGVKTSRKTTKEP